MKKLLLLFALLCVPAVAQVHSDIATQNTQGNWVKAIPGAQVYLCDVATTDVACLVGTGLVSTYADQTLTPPALTQPAIADSNGNYTIYATPGIYKQCVKGITSFCQIIEIGTLQTVVPVVTCPGAINGSLAAWTSPTNLSCDNQSKTDFVGNLQSQSYQAVGPHNGEVWLTTNGVLSSSTLSAGTIGLVVPNVVPVSYRFNFPPAICTDGQVLQQLSHSTDATGTLNAFFNCFTSSSGITLQTNSVNNSSQSLLNLINGTGCTFTNTSGGNVSLACSGGPTLQTNGVNNSSQTTLNNANGTAVYGFQVTPSNSSGGNVVYNITTPYTAASNPTAPTVTPTNPGSTAYTYGIAGCQDVGCTRHSALVTTATSTGNATLNNTNPITLSAYADTLYGYRYYVICRTASAGTPNTTGVIYSGAWKSFKDNGLAGDSSNCATTYATNNTKLDDHCLGGNPSVVNALMGVPCTVDGPPASPKAPDDEGTSQGTAVPGDSNSPFWTWVNQGSCTSAYTGGMINISCPSEGAHALHCLVRTAPATPYTMDMLTWWHQIASGSQTGTTYRALALRESSTGKLVTIGGYSTNNTSVNQVLIGKWTNATTNSSFGYETGSGILSQPEEFSAQNDGTNIVFKSSPDGINYSQALSEAKATFFTTAPDQYGICLDPNSGAAFMDVDRVRETQ